MVKDGDIVKYVYEEIDSSTDAPPFEESIYGYAWPAPSAAYKPPP